MFISKSAHDAIVAAKDAEISRLSARLRREIQEANRHFRASEQMAKANRVLTARLAVFTTAIDVPKPLSAAELGEYGRYIHGADYFDNSAEAVAARKARFNELNDRYLATRPTPAIDSVLTGGAE